MFVGRLVEIIPLKGALVAGICLVVNSTVGRVWGVRVWLSVALASGMRTDLAVMVVLVGKVNLMELVERAGSTVKVTGDKEELEGRVVSRQSGGWTETVLLVKGRNYHVRIPLEGILLWLIGFRGRILLGRWVRRRIVTLRFDLYSELYESWVGFILYMYHTKDDFDYTPCARL